MQIIRLPAKTLIVLCGPAGAGKSTFAAHHFQPTQVVSSDMCRGLICDRPHHQGINRQTFALFHHILQLRLEQGRLSVADSTALEGFARDPLLKLAREAGYHTCLLAFSFAEEVYQRQNRLRTKPVPLDVVWQQSDHFHDHTLREIREEPWDQLHIFEEWPQELRFMRAITRRARPDGLGNSSIDSASQAG